MNRLALQFAYLTIFSQFGAISIEKEHFDSAKNTHILKLTPKRHNILPLTVLIHPEKLTPFTINSSSHDEEILNSRIIKAIEIKLGELDGKKKIPKVVYKRIIEAVNVTHHTHLCDIKKYIENSTSLSIHKRGLLNAVDRVLKGEHLLGKTLTKYEIITRDACLDTIKEYGKETNFEEMVEEILPKLKGKQNPSTLSSHIANILKKSFQLDEATKRTLERIRNTALYMHRKTHEKMNYEVPNDIPEEFREGKDILTPLQKITLFACLEAIKKDNIDEDDKYEKMVEEILPKLKTKTPSALYDILRSIFSLETENGDFLDRNFFEQLKQIRKAANNIYDRQKRIQV